MSRLRSIADRVDAVKRLGLSWLLFRVWYAAKTSLGIVERSSPTSEWFNDDTAPVHELPKVVAVDSLRTWLLANYSAEEVEELRRHAKRLSERRFDVFGTEAQLKSWHHDPIHDLWYDRTAHWSRVPHLNGVDVKCIWEPSRFGWAYDLARLHLIDPASGASELFWELLESWMAENPPNTGINWNCGQEAGIRLMAVILAADVMRDSLSPRRVRKVERLADATGNRILANISYARSQRNNHHTSESAGLIAVASFFPNLKKAPDMMSVGVREMDRACRNLVLPDGGTSQYSVNYHRVFLHGMSWAIVALRWASEQISSELSGAFRRASNFWTEICDPTSGFFPAIGHDDGANALPTAKLPHRNGWGCATFSNAVDGRPVALPEGRWDESVFWAGKEYIARTEPCRADAAGVESYPNMGVHILWCGDYRVIFRCGPFDFRPAHADQLHLDVWHRGEPITTAPGTFSYNPVDQKGPELSESVFHNTITIGGQSHMRHVSRFLFADWVHGEVILAESNGESVSRCEGVLALPKASFCRLIEVRTSGVCVTDRSSGVATTHWQVRDSAYAEVGLGPSFQTTSSDGYRTLSSRQRVDVTFTDELRTSIADGTIRRG